MGTRRQEMDLDEVCIADSPLPLPLPAAADTPDLSSSPPAQPCPTAADGDCPLLSPVTAA